MFVIITPVTNTQTFSKIQICHLTTLNIQPLESIFLFRRTKFEFLAVTLTSVWGEEAYTAPTQIQNAFKFACKKKGIVNVLFRINLQKFSRVQNAKKKSYPQIFLVSTNAAIKPSDAFRKAKDLFQKKYKSHQNYKL